MKYDFFLSHICVYNYANGGLQMLETSLCIEYLDFIENANLY